MISRMDNRFREWRTRAPIILIVGADDFIRDMRADVLSAGLRAACAPDASEALAAITHEKPALVVVDGAMPDLDRRWFFAKLERTPALARIPRTVRSRGELLDVEDRQERQDRDRNQRRRQERDRSPTTFWALRGPNRA
jgi:CheY-like chemotaxis protein